MRSLDRPAYFRNSIIRNEKEAVVVQEKAVAVLQKHPGIPHGIVNSQQRSPAVRYFLENNLFLKGFCIKLDDGHLGSCAVVAADPIHILFCAGGHIINVRGIHIDGLDGFPL